MQVSVVVFFLSILTCSFFSSLHGCRVEMLECVAVWDAEFVFGLLLKIQFRILFFWAL
jgi:hypothetical protein